MKRFSQGIVNEQEVVPATRFFWTEFRSAEAECRVCTDERTRHSLGYDRQETAMFLLEYLGDRSDLSPLDEEIDQVRFCSAEEACQYLAHQETRAYFIRGVLQKEQKGG